MAILFDEMLKRTATWCRILGIDSEFLTGRNDSQLLDYAKNNNLVFVTRDLPLSLRCEKHGVKCILVKSDILEEQIAQIAKETGTEITFPEKTRCPKCNGELETVSQENVREEVPETVMQHEKFWRCRKCSKIYWEGSHWKNITNLYEKVKVLL